MPYRATIPGRLGSTDRPSYSHYNCLPGGLKCFIAVATESTFTNTEVTLTDWDTGDITTLANRLYCVSAEAAVQTGHLGDTLRLWLTDGDNNHFIHSDVRITDTVNANGQIGHNGFSFLHAPGAGTRRYKLRGVRIKGSGTQKLAGVAGSIQVHDVGPVF